jgi:hypothetical protein
MDRLKVLEEIAKTGSCSQLTVYGPCSTCPIGNISINGVLISVDCWDVVLKGRTCSSEEISEAYKKEATRILLEILLEEALK